MGCPAKAQELREFMALAMKLRIFARQCDIADTDLYLAAAETLEQRANHLAFGGPEPPRRCKFDMMC